MPTPDVLPEQQGPYSPQEGNLLSLGANPGELALSTQGTAPTPPPSVQPAPIQIPQNPQTPQPNYDSLIAAIERQTAQSQNPFYRIGSHWAGQNPDTEVIKSQAMLHDLIMRQRASAMQEQLAQSQIPHIQSQTQLLQGQLSDLGFKTLQHASIFLPFIPADQQQKYIDSVRPMIQQQFKMGMGQDPAGQQLASNNTFIDSMIRSGAEKGNAFVSSWPFVPESAKAIVAQTAMSDPSKAMTLAKEFSDENKKNIVLGVGQRIAAMGPSPVTRNLDQVLTSLGVTPLMKAAVDSWIQDQKPEAVNAFLAKYNITSPHIQAKFLESQAGAMGTQTTPQGAATLAETKARTIKEGLFTTPGPGGVTGIIPGSLAEKQMGGEQPMMQLPSGATVPQGTRILATSPGQPVDQAAAQRLIQVETTNAALQGAKKLVSTGKLDQFMGPWMTGARYNEWSQKNLPEWYAGKVPTALTLLDQAEAMAKNWRIVDRTGAAVRESEEPRILAETPNRFTDKPEVYKAKLNYFADLVDTINRRNHELMGPDGRPRVGVNPDEVAKRYPLPQFGADTGRTKIDFGKEGIRIRKPDGTYYND